jgi:hypothetical protein
VEEQTMPTDLTDLNAPISTYLDDLAAFDEDCRGYDEEDDLEEVQPEDEDPREFLTDLWSLTW